MQFPLADWVLDHRDAPHNLGVSGLEGSLRSTPAALRTHPDPDPDRLRHLLARQHGVADARVFLTHGATEGNALALGYLRRRIRAGRGGSGRLYSPNPEYPPLPDAATVIGFRRTRRVDQAQVVALSAPRNPLGTRVALGEIRAYSEERRRVLVDQTFREFTRDAPITRSDLSRIWLTGTFTKAYGTDDLRVGFVIPPSDECDDFATFHGLLLDRLPAASISGALALLAHRREILGEARALFRANERLLRAAISGVPDLAAPVWFDRGNRGADGDRFARALLRRGVLVCPGSFFGSPSGVRICLTKRSFGEDLAAYLSVRSVTPGFR